MKINSLITVSILVGALQLSPVVFGQGANESVGGRWQQRLANLSPEEREKLKAARQKAMQDPSVQAAEEKMKEARTEFVTAMRAAMLKADPSIQPVLNKIPRGSRGERDED
jgi:membrane glycosyltransferase